MGKNGKTRHDPQYQVSLSRQANGLLVQLANEIPIHNSFEILIIYTRPLLKYESAHSFLFDEVLMYLCLLNAIRIPNPGPVNHALSSDPVSVSVSDVVGVIHSL